MLNKNILPSIEGRSSLFFNKPIVLLSIVTNIALN